MSAFFALVGQFLCIKYWFHTLHTFVGMKLADICRICKIAGDIWLFCLQSAGGASDAFDGLRRTSVAQHCWFSRWKINSEGAVAKHLQRSMHSMNK